MQEHRASRKMERDPPSSTQVSNPHSHRRASWSLRPLQPMRAVDARETAAPEAAPINTLMTHSWEE